jgi:uncharacterized protein YkwD
MHREPSSLVKVLVPLAFAVLLATPLAQGNPASRELRDGLRLAHLEQINRERARYQLPPVRLDSFASVMGDRYCEQQIEQRTTGHFLTDGHAPYMRYSLAGGADGMSENAAAWSANYRFTDSMLPDLIQQSLNAMMGEVPPQDGHRRAILDRHATHVGIGMAWEESEFRLVQQFIRRYVEWEGVAPREASVRDRVELRGNPYPGFVVEVVSVHFEKHPRRMSATMANRISSYSLPKSRRDYLPKVDRKGEFSVSVPFRDGPGVYTVVAWVRLQRGSDLIPASNISILVDD